MSLFRESMIALGGGLMAAAGEVVLYRRGNLTVEDLDAAPVRAEVESYGDDDQAFTARNTDWIIAAADLVLEGIPIEPSRGDAIDWTDETGTKRSFAVLPRAGDRVFRHADPTRVLLRVYTVEDAPSPDQ